jgi:hypothetical protein
MTSKLDSILKLEVPIIVRIGRKKLKMKDISDISPGMIIELAKPADEELDLLVNNVPIGQGLAVKVCENFGISISFIGDVRARIEALGGGPTIANSSEDVGEIDEDEAAALAEQFLAG